MFFRRLLTVSILSCAASAAQAQTATMDWSTLLPFANYDPTPQTFGDRAGLNVTNTTRAAFGNSGAVCNYVDMWGAGYSTLAGVGFACGNGQYGELLFQPTAGKRVTLDKFSVASFNSSSLNMNIRVFDTSWNQLFTYTGLITAAQVITPNITSNTGLYLQWGTEWNTGVNLVQTTISDILGTPPVTTTPEPASFVLVGAGMGVVAMVRRRRRSRAASVV